MSRRRCCCTSSSRHHNNNNDKNAAPQQNYIVFISFCLVDIVYMGLVAVFIFKCDNRVG